MEHPSTFRCPASQTCAFLCCTKKDMVDHVCASHMRWVKIGPNSKRRQVSTPYACADCDLEFAHVRRYYDHLRLCERQQPTSSEPLEEEENVIDDRMDIDSGELRRDLEIDALLREKNDASSGVVNQTVLLDQGQYSEVIHDAVSVGYGGMLCDRYASVATVVDAINISEKLISATVIRAKQIVKESIMEHNVSSSEPLTAHQSRSIERIMKFNLEDMGSPLSYINTPYKLEKFFFSDEFYVGPEFVSFMHDMGDDIKKRWRFHQSKRLIEEAPGRWCGFQRLSIKGQLTAFFSAHPMMIDRCMGPESGPEPSIISESVHGEFIRQRAEVFEGGRRVVCIKVSQDDVTVTDNGNGKQCVYQMNIANLPHYVGTNPCAQFLLAQGNADDFMAYYANDNGGDKLLGHDLYLRWLSKEIRKLERYGFTVIDNRSGTPVKVRIHVMFCLIGCDNLAQHVVMRFAASFSMTHFPCIICRIHHDDIGRVFDGFNLLKQPEYEVMAERAHRAFQVSVAANKAEQSQTGINGKCQLVTNYWSLTTNRYADIMHDLDEGLAMYTLKFVLRHCCLNKMLPGFNIETLNAAVAAFRAGSSDTSNRVCKIRPSSMEAKTARGIKFDKKDKLLTKNQKKESGMGMKAAQTFSFVRLLPEIIPASLLPRDTPAWRLLMQLRAMCLFWHSFSFTRDQLSVFNQFLEKHCETLKALVLDFIAKNKHHHVTHFCLMCLMHGPPTMHSCYMYERQLAYTCKTARSSGNSRNIPKTCAKRRQITMCVRNCAKLADCDKYTGLGAHSCIRPDFLDEMPDNMRLLLKDAVISKRFGLRGYNYIGGMCLLMRYDYNGWPVMCKIIGYVIDDVVKDKVLVSYLRVIDYNKEVKIAAYIVEDPDNDFDLLDIRDAIDFHTVDLYEQKDSDQSNVYLYSDCRWATSMSVHEF